LIIVIPTFMREDNQKCYNAMPPEIQSRVYMTTHSGRAEILKQNNPTANIVDLGKTDGIADVRQKVIEYFHNLGETKVMIIDDSCTFKKRDENLKLVNMELEDWNAMFDMVETNLDTYPMVGISDQGGNNRVTDDLKEVGRSYSCYGLNVDFLFKNGIRFDGMYQKDKEIKLYEDFYLILKLLTSGSKNAVIYKYAFNHPHGRKGGNSTIRTNELQKKCILSLVHEFPGLVELVKKENPSWKAGLDDQDEFRWEVKISWQEAYKRGLEGEVASLEDFFS
jgi:hypothetical protein